jgi:hypothetical protein
VPCTEKTIPHNQNTPLSFYRERLGMGKAKLLFKVTKVSSPRNKKTSALLKQKALKTIP